MAKSRKKIFPKPVPRLTTESSKLLGKNSNKVGREANLLGIYHAYNTVNKLTPQQMKQLESLKKQLQSLKQKQ
jgi:hypothetical protein